MGFENFNQPPTPIKKKEGQEKKFEKIDFDYEKSKEIGKNMQVALEKEGPEAGAKYREQNLKAWDQASENINSFYNSFNHSSEEELVKQYSEYMEPENSKFNLGGVLVSLDSIATRDGFFNKEQDEKTKGTIEILNKLRKLELLKQ